MRFNLTPASHRVLEQASRLRLQRGIAAISAAKVLWALFEEDEFRAAQWLQEAGLTLEQFAEAFGISLLQSPIAPPFAQGSYGVPIGQYTPPAPPSPELASARAGNNSPPIGNPYFDQPQQEDSQQEHEDEPKEQHEDVWEPSEQPKYSFYSQQGQKKPGQSRLQFYLDDQLIHIGLLTPELENDLETAALRFIRQDRQQSISVSGGTAGGVKQIAFGTPVFTLTTEHLLLAVVLDTGDVGRWLRDNGLDAAELYQRIDALSEHRSNDLAGIPAPTINEAIVEPEYRLNDLFLYRLLDAAANRGREAIRVIEDYVRFLLNDADLTQRLKTFRHQFQEVLEQFPMQTRLEARNTEHDVGTDISADGEYQRPTLGDLLSANFSRLQESLRSLEEFSKMFDPHIARQFEQLRYQGYTLQKDVTAEPQSNETVLGAME